ncbi:MAG: triose-phosphate isomerase [Phycisphaerales bacterium]|nr:triose-phosphate isomerase [Phycisphaerales bacterium]
MRKPLVAGNWKMNLNRAQAVALAATVRQGAESNQPSLLTQVEVAVCPPAVYLLPVVETVGPQIAVGAQNLYQEHEGAFTGEISAAMIADTGCRYVLVGHSERRHTIGHHEDDRMLNLKTRAARKAGLVPILCVGETLGERKAGETLDVLTFQLTAGLVGVQPASGMDLVIAYEPVWAIGTGETATPQQAQEAHAHLRAELRRLVGNVADQVRILYGGSVKPDNATEIFGQPDVDGGLIGGASLKADSFLAIAASALAAARK